MVWILEACHRSLAASHTLVSSLLGGGGATAVAWWGGVAATGPESSRQVAEVAGWQGRLQVRDWPSCASSRPSCSVLAPGTLHAAREDVLDGCVCVGHGHSFRDFEKRSRRFTLAEAGSEVLHMVHSCACTLSLSVHPRTRHHFVQSDSVPWRRTAVRVGKREI